MRKAILSGSRFAIKKPTRRDDIMTKKLLALIMASIMLLSLFTACNEPPKITEEPTQSEQVPEDTSPTEKVALNYWSMWNENETQSEVLKDSITRFKADNSNVEVNVTWVGRDIRNTIKSALDAGQKIDVIEYDPEYLTKNCQDNLLQLNDYIDKAYPITGEKTIRERCIPVLFKWIEESSTDGGIYGVPSQPIVAAFFYNKDHFEKAGITSVPKTWEEFLGVCDSLKSAGYTPYTMDDAYMDLLIGYYLGRAKGQDWVKQLVADKTGEMWKDPAVLQMARDFDNMRVKGYLSENIAGTKWPAGQQEVANGEVTMYLTGSWLPNELKDITGPDFRWGSFSFPSVPNGIDSASAAVIGAQGFAISKNCTNPDAAFSLITYFNADETEAGFAEKCISAPVTPNVAWPTVIEDVKAVYNSIDKYYSWGCGINEDPDLQPIAISNFIKVLGGTLTPEKFVDEMVKAATRS